MSRYRTNRVQLQDRQNKVLYMISKQCTGQEGSRYRTSRVQLQDRQTRYRISRQCAGKERSRHRTCGVQLQDRQNKVQDQQSMNRIKTVKVQDKQGPATGQAK